MTAWTSLDVVRDEALACTRCPLAETRTQVVFGVGDPGADLLFVGEAPGKNEDLRGEPFVGAAGKLRAGVVDTRAGTAEPEEPAAEAILPANIPLLEPTATPVPTPT